MVMRTGEQLYEPSSMRLLWDGVDRAFADLEDSADTQTGTRAWSKPTERIGIVSHEESKVAR